MAAKPVTLEMPKVFPPAENVTVPVGPIPLLEVPIKATNITGVFVFTPVLGFAVTLEICVAADVITIVFVGDALAL